MRERKSKQRKNSVSDREGQRGGSKHGGREEKVSNKDKKTENKKERSKIKITKIDGKKCKKKNTNIKKKRKLPRD